MTRLQEHYRDNVVKSLMEQFKKDRDSEATADVVARDRKQGEGLDIQGTPSIFINGRLFPSSQDFERDLDEWIALEIELTTGVSAVKETKPAAAPPGSAPAPSGSAAPAASVPAASASVRPSPAPSAAPSAKAKTP